MTDIEFKPWPKIARLNRDIIITEKIDGTNAAVGVTDDGFVYAQSRTRVITPEKDNFGFAKWVLDHQAELAFALGPGLHFGEWWGPGIQRGYGLAGKRFSLFNVKRFRDVPFAEMGLPEVGIVPIIYEGAYSQAAVDRALNDLKNGGSDASPGFMRPEGIVVFHTAANQMFKVTLEGDAAPKGAAA